VSVLAGPPRCNRCPAPYSLLLHGELACTEHALEILEERARRPYPLSARLRSALAMRADDSGHWLADRGCKRAPGAFWGIADRLRGLREVGHP
jgi:hypothetical protein